MRRKKIIPIVLILAAGGFFLWRYLAGDNDRDVLKLSGNIELTEVTLSFKLPGRLLELAVDEGAEVTRGQLLAQLDRDELERGMDRERATVRVAETMLAQTRTALDYQRAAIGGDVALRRAELRSAESRLGELLAGSRQQEKDHARAAVAEAATQHEQAGGDWERAQKLIRDDDISAQQFDQFKARFEATRAALQRAKETLALVEEGPRQEQIEQQRAAVERARAALALAEAGHIDLARRQQEIGTREAEILRARAQVGVLDTQLNDRTLLAPVDGVVLSKSAEAGEVLAAGAAVLAIGDIDRPWVRAYIAESDLGRVQLGMPAAVTTDSFPGKRYNGRVTFISAEAEFTPKQIQTQEERVKLVYRIKIEVENPNRELKSNMPVDAEIRLR